jgi:hypothetical protein
MSPHNNYSLAEFIHTVFETSADKTSAVVSAAMISSPLWLSSVQPVSDIAALFAPILGCIYLSLQIGFKLLDRARNEK